MSRSKGTRICVVEQIISARIFETHIRIYVFRYPKRRYPFCSDGTAFRASSIIIGSLDERSLTALSGNRPVLWCVVFVFGDDAISTFVCWFSWCMYVKINGVFVWSMRYGADRFDVWMIEWNGLFIGNIKVLIMY